jgi:23S rRNA (uridine2479-2'-O)-methyltransferase
MAPAAARRFAPGADPVQPPAPMTRRPPARLVRLHSENDRFQHAETLKRNRQKRHAHRELFVEGVRNLDQAVAHGWPFRALFYAANRPLSAWARALRARAAAATEVACAPALMAKLSDKVDPSELCAIVGMPEDRLDRIPDAPALKLVVLDRPQNPGNLGTILRTCDAFGVHGVVITGHAVDLYDPLVIRASMGSFFAVPSVRVASHREVLSWLAPRRAAGLRLVGTSARAEQSLRSEELAAPIALAFGNESEGLSHAWREACDTLVRIPMAGTASSLNITSAVAIVLYQQSLARP